MSGLACSQCELAVDDLPAVDVVLASPPCTDFSLACMVQKWDIEEARRPRYLPKWESIAESVQIVFRTLWLIQELQPDYWFLENPRWGALRQIIGEPAGTVHYCQYGSEFKKPTGTVLLSTDSLWLSRPSCSHGASAQRTSGEP